MKSFKEAAYQILRDAGKPLYIKEITRIAIERGLKSSGKTPAATMNAQLVVDINSKKNKSRFKKAGKSIFTLNDNFVPPRMVEPVLDLFSRGIVGLAMDKTIADTLTTQAMNQAILRRNPEKGLILHSDRGSQYAGKDFKAILTENKFVGSMSKKGDCWDNAVAESFFHTLKVELVHRNKFKTREEAKRMIFK